MWRLKDFYSCLAAKISRDTIPVPGKRVTILLSLVLLLGAGMILKVAGKDPGAEPPNTGLNVSSSVEIKEVLRQNSLLQRSGRFNDSMTLLREALRKYPDDLDLSLSLGITLRKARLSAQAEEIYSILLKKNSSCLECLNNQAVNWLQTGEVERAIAGLLSLQMRAPQFADAALNLAVAYEKAGQSRLALDSYQKYLKLISVNDSRSEPALARERIRRLEEGL